MNPQNRSRFPYVSFGVPFCFECCRLSINLKLHGIVHVVLDEIAGFCRTGDEGVGSASYIDRTESLGIFHFKLHGHAGSGGTRRVVGKQNALRPENGKKALFIKYSQKESFAFLVEKNLSVENGVIRRKEMSPVPFGLLPDSPVVIVITGNLCEIIPFVSDLNRSLILTAQCGDYITGFERVAVGKIGGWKI